MPFSYLSGEPVMMGDRIRYHGEPGEIEFIAEASDPDTADFVEQFGGGCMIMATGFGSVFVHHPDSDEDLEFVSRAMK
jgi:hypothetical protein